MYEWHFILFGESRRRSLPTCGESSAGEASAPGRNRTDVTGNAIRREGFPGYREFRINGATGRQLLWRRSEMKKYLLGVAFAALMSSYAHGRERRRVDGPVRRQLPDRAAQRHDRVRQDPGRREPAGRGRAERRRQATRPDQELRRFRRRRHHRQPGRHFRHAGDVGRRRGGQYSAGLRQPRAGQRRYAARQPGLRRLERKGFGHAGDEGGLPSVQGGRQDRGERLRHHGRAVEPGRRAADRGYRRRDRDAGMLLHQDHRQADLELAARPGAEPDDQLAVDRLPSSTA